jgi:hypothetical protein
MAGHIHIEKSLDDKEIKLEEIAGTAEELMISRSDYYIFPDLRNQPTESQPTALSPTHAQDALVTDPPDLLKPRQNNPQDCSNLIIASVDRATVEISRTIIALNATFSQQLQQASISASNGIRSAENSASSMINVVSQSASVATSSAFSIATVARLAVTSANDALTSVSIASSSDVSRLSSSLSLIQANLDSAQVKRDYSALPTFSEN